MSRSFDDVSSLQRAFADLEMLICSPSLVTQVQLEQGALSLLGHRLPYECKLVDFERRAKWLQILKNQHVRGELEDVLRDELSTLKTRRIGLYAERLLCSLFKVLPDHHLLAHNLQIHHDDPSKQTLGALDFLIQTPQGIEHLELTVKFYLKLHIRGGWDQWLGPNERDTMAQKMRKMLTHQLPLSQHPSTQKQFMRLNLPLVHLRSLFCIGHIFEEVIAKKDAVTLTQDLPRSVWIRQNHFAHVQAMCETTRWVIRPYPDWLHCDPELFRATQTYCKTELLQQPLERGRYMMVSEINNFYQELRRWMVVSESWGRS